MKFKIVGDSSTDVDQIMKEKMNITIAPLTLEVNGVRYIDDETFDVDEYLSQANASPQIPKSSCPSPDDYLNAYRCDAEAIFVITLSAALSGSYASAILAKDLMLEEEVSKKIHVFNSKSASSGQVAIAMKIMECIEADMVFEDIVTVVEDYITEMVTVFVLEKIDHLQKAGRMTKTKAALANVLNIKLVLKADENGDILLHSQARGTNKAIDRMIDALGEIGTVSKDKILVVSYCQAKERGEYVKKKIEELYNFKDVLLVRMRGLSSNYANSGGIIIAF